MWNSSYSSAFLHPEDVATFLDSAVQLESFRIYNISNTEEDAENIAAALRRNTNIERLELFGFSSEQAEAVRPERLASEWIWLRLRFPRLCKVVA